MNFASFITDTKLMHITDEVVRGYGLCIGTGFGEEYHADKLE